MKNYSDKKILIVDDVADIRMMLKIICQDIGCQIDLAENGEKAFRAITQNSYDLILLDIMMPEWDGVTTIKGLEFYNIKPKIIVISGYITDELKTELKDLEFVSDYVNKPFEIKYVRQLITKHLDDDESE